jgi:DNA polymerase III delta prime subunit
MLTLFEGPDGAGKTTLIAAYARRLQGKYGKEPVIRAHGVYPGVVDLAGVYLTDCLAALRGATILMDRGWPSEAVYGPRVRRANRITVAGRRMLERVALAARGQVILCLPPFETCRENYLARKHLEYLPDDHALRQVYDDFNQLNTNLPAASFNYKTEPSKIAYADMIEHFRAPANPGPGVGRYFPGVTLLVGEQVSEPTAAAYLPFVSADPAGCTAWLSQRLEEWGIPERALYWVNALDIRGRATQGGPWLHDLKPKRVVAMGVVANQWCLEQGLTDHASIPHPQYWRRFNHNQPYVLRELLT